MKFVLFFYHLIVLNCAWADVAWKVTGDSDFTASAVFSKESISLFESLTVTLTLIYPSSYQPNISEIRMHLFQHDGIGGSPFVSISETISDPKIFDENLQTQTLQFHLSPQVLGRHYLTFYNIPFESKTKIINLMSGIVAILIYQPEISFDVKAYEPELLGISPVFPIGLSFSNKNKLLKTHQQEMDRNLQLVSEKTFPWFSFCLIIISIIFSVLFIKTKTLPKAMISPKKLASKKFKQISIEPSPALYSHLTQILNQHLEERYPLTMLSKSSEERLMTISTLPMSTYTLKSLNEFILRADQIKFGLQNVSSQQAKDDYFFIKKIINKL